MEWGGDGWTPPPPPPPWTYPRMLPLLALHTASEYYRAERKPPVTAALLAANALVYLRPGVLDSVLPHISEVWFNPHLIFKNHDLKRLYLSVFYHTSEPHLVYNMMSLLWKGIQLENSMGSFEFASMVAALLGMSQGMTLVLSKSLLSLFNYERAYYDEFAVGFSGVLFALKVVLNSQSANNLPIYGLLVPARYAAWAELILIQMLVPGVSFLSHLGGILAGMLYLHLKSSNSGWDPLAGLIRGIAGVLSKPRRLIRGFFRTRRRRLGGRAIFGEGRSGWAAPGMWRCQACTYENSGLLTVCEMCRTSRSSGGFSAHPSSRSGDISLEELRRRRVERFG